MEEEKKNINWFVWFVRLFFVTALTFVITGVLFLIYLMVDESLTLESTRRLGSGKTIYASIFSITFVTISILLIRAHRKR